MTNTQENRSILLESESIISPGVQLRRARENRRLSLEAVAAELHVVPKIVAALEADDYDRLPSPVFVRGYLRNYSRIVSLPPEPLIETYNRMAGTEAFPVSPQVRAEVGDDRQLHWGVYLSAVAMLVLLTVWASSGRGLRFWENTPPASETSETLPPVAAQQNQSAPDNASPPRDETGMVESPAQEAPPGPVIAAGPTGAQPATSESATPVPTPSPAAVAPVAVAQTTASAASPSPAPEPVTGQGPDTLTIRLSSDSWVAIRDASGQRLVYGTLTAGAARTVRGQAPFALVIGNSPAAQIEFNGQPFEHVKYAKGLVARFKVTK